MTESGIDSAKAKLFRAKEHLGELDKSVKAFRKSSPYEFRPQYKPNETNMPDLYYRVIVNRAHPVPKDWPLISGDILTNLRAALDHSVFPHIKSVKPELEDKDIQFPIYDQRSQFENKARWFRRPVYRVVNAAQPYHESEPEWHSLAILRKLVNADKHRRLLIANYAPVTFDIHAEEPLSVVEKVVYHDVEMLEGNIIAGCHLRLTRAVEKPSWMPLPSQIGYSECIVIPDTSEKRALLDVMSDLIGVISRILDQLEKAGA